MGLGKVFYKPLEKEGEITAVTNSVHAVLKNGTINTVRYVMDEVSAKEVIRACVYNKHPSGDYMFKVDLEEGRVNTMAENLVPLSEKNKQFKSIW